MPSITSTGIGSGLDIAGIVQKLVAAEAQSAETRIGKQESRVQVRLSAFGSLKGALSGFMDTLDTMSSVDKFLVRKASSEDESILTVSAGTSAVPAPYSVEVLQLAQAQKLASGAFADADAIVGTGTLQFTVGADSFDVEITAENNTLAGIRNAINDASDNAGIAATIVNADDGSYLILTGEQTGVSNAIGISQSGGDGGLSVLEFSGAGGDPMDELIAAQDAEVLIDGRTVSSSTNTIAGAIEGVTITALQADPGQAVTVAVENDQQAVRALIDDFVDSYNQLVDVFDQLTSYDAESGTAGPLLGDSAARTARDQIRRELSTAVGSIDAGFSTLPEIGIELQLDGKLQVDDTVLSAALADDFSGIGQLFAASDGFAARLSDLVDQHLSADGGIESRTEGLNAQVEDIAGQRQRLDERLSRLEDRLYKQFNALDSLLAQLSQTSNFLSQQLSNLPGFVTPSNKS
jgi:flagellar hook-associated protein 2